MAADASGSFQREAGVLKGVWGGDQWRVARQQLSQRGWEVRQVEELCQLTSGVSSGQFRYALFCFIREASQTDTTFSPVQWPMNILTPIRSNNTAHAVHSYSYTSILVLIENNLILCETNTVDSAITPHLWPWKWLIQICTYSTKLNSNSILATFKTFPC